ncbi:MATE family efflux transporter [Minwuia sp.]|uniref:MATE family efflux transporter n=1 Tax=Minwuia sp. TaxID=2493630 RepID=UPI003A948EFB
MTADAQLPRSSGLLWDVTRTLKLAGPVIVARSGVLIMMAVDTAMTGRAGGDELAAFGIGLSPTIALTMLGLGFLLGVSILTSQADGAGEPARSGTIWKTGLWHAGLLGLVFVILCLFGEELLLLIGQSPVLSENGGRVMQMLGFGMPAVLIFVTCSFFLEGLSRPLPGMLIMLGANVVNFGLNWVLIYGNLGFSGMGAEGAALATTLARWMTAFVILGYIWWMRDRDRFGIRNSRGDWAVGRRLRRLGYPMALAMFVEVAAFMAMTQMAGFLGNDATAGYQIAHNLVALVFMSAIGLGAATGVRVGNAVGRQDPAGVRGAGLAGIGLVVVIMAVLGSFFLTMPEVLVNVYSGDPAVAAFALPALAVAGSMMIFDGTQAVLVNALRALGDVWFPMGAQIVAFWILAAPVSWVLAFEMGYGTAGLMGGIYVGVVAATLINGARFLVMAKRPLRRS